MRNNISALALIAAVAATQFAGCAADSNQRSTGRVLDDSVITAKVKTALIKAPEVDALDINVTTYLGVVQLSGFVDSVEQASKAVSTARQVEGVRGVRDDLRVAAAVK